MGLEEKYPKSGLYREHKKAIEAHVDEKMEFTKDLWEDGDKIVSAEENVLGHIEDEFGIPHESLKDITNEEKADVINFARYANKRLANAALHSPVYKDLLREGKFNEAMEKGTRFASSYHDVLHSMFAYDRTKGKSLSPAYLEMNNDSQWTDPLAIQEEMMVFVWENFSSFEERLSGDDPEALIGFYGGKEMVRDDDYARIRESISVRETLPLEYRFGILETGVFLPMQLSNAQDLETDIRRAFEFITNNRDPEYIRLVTLMYENSHSESPDPKILLHEFQWILQPLLERLRNKKANEGETALESGM